MPEPDHANPMKATRITIKGSSGYCPVDVAFHERDQGLHSAGAIESISGDQPKQLEQMPMK